MIFSVDFGSAQTGVGYTFFDSGGVAIGSRVTTGINAGSQAGMYFVVTRPPDAAKLIFWDCDDPTLTARDDIQELLRLERLGAAFATSAGNDFYNHVKRAFIETLLHVGITITFKGVNKQCVTGAIEKKRAADVSGYLPQAATQIDILDDDFNAFSGIGDRSTVTVAGLALRIIAIDNEPQDPIVHLIVINDK